MRNASSCIFSSEKGNAIERVTVDLGATTRGRAYRSKAMSCKKDYGYIIIEMDDKEERKSPMIIMSLCCLFLLYFFNSLSTELPKYIYALCFSGAFIISLFSFINIRFKISLHATGVGIFTGFLMAYFVDQIYFKVYFLALAFILSGLVITARLYLQKHSFKEVILGYFLSLLITFVLNLYYPTATII